MYGYFAPNIQNSLKKPGFFNRDVNENFNLAQDRGGQKNCFAKAKSKQLIKVCFTIV